GRPIFRVLLPGSGAGEGFSRHAAAPAWNRKNTLIAASGSTLSLITLGGTIVDTVHLDGPVAGGPVIGSHATVWVLTSVGSRDALSDSGSLERHIALGIQISPDTGIALSPDGSLRIGSSDDALLSLDAAGLEKWRLDSEGPFPGPLTVDEDGTTVAVSRHGRL